MLPFGSLRPSLIGTPEDPRVGAEDLHIWWKATTRRSAAKARFSAQSNSNRCCRSKVDIRAEPSRTSLPGRASPARSPSGGEYHSGLEIAWEVNTAGLKDEHLGGPQTFSAVKEGASRQPGMPFRGGVGGPEVT